MKAKCDEILFSETQRLIEAFYKELKTEDSPIEFDEFFKNNFEDLLA